MGHLAFSHLVPIYVPLTCAVMSDHYHLVLPMDKETAERWSEGEIIDQRQPQYSHRDIQMIK